MKDKFVCSWFLKYFVCVLLGNRGFGRDLYCVVFLGVF